jgi:hypothetical protein
MNLCYADLDLYEVCSVQLFHFVSVTSCNPFPGSVNEHIQAILAFNIRRALHPSFLWGALYGSEGSVCRVN